MKIKDLIKVLSELDEEKEIYIMNPETLTYTKEFTLTEGILSQHFYLDAYDEKKFYVWVIRLWREVK